MQQQLEDLVNDMYDAAYYYDNSYYLQEFAERLEKIIRKNF